LGAGSAELLRVPLVVLDGEAFGIEVSLDAVGAAGCIGAGTLLAAGVVLSPGVAGLVAVCA
jgi:hypothetical protein